MKKVMLCANFAWILILALIFDYSDTELEAIEGVAYSNYKCRFSDYRYNREDFRIIDKKSRSEWIVKYCNYGNVKQAVNVARAPEPDCGKNGNPIQKSTNAPQAKPRDTSRDDCYVLHIGSRFFDCYILGVLILLASSLGLWGITFLPGIIRRRTEAELRIFDAKNWYNAQRRLFFTFQNDSYMRFFRAACYLEGLGGCAKNISRAKKLFRKSANQGLLESFCALGYMNQHGLGGEIDLTQARGYYMEAKNLGCELAARLLDGLHQVT